MSTIQSNRNIEEDANHKTQIQWIKWRNGNTQYTSGTLQLSVDDMIMTKTDNEEK